MHLSTAEARALAGTLAGMLPGRADVDVVVCPPYLSLHPVRSVVQNTAIKLGAQDTFWKDEGAFTGKVSARMLRDAGASHCIVGHSETRGRFGRSDVPDSTLPFFGETDETVNLKIRSLLYQAIMPILCVGETASERERGETEAVIARQLKGAFKEIDPAELYTSVVAYEPVWAIGTGESCGAEEAGRVIGFIRETLADVLDPEVADDMRILYGGSVKASNALELFSQKEIDGGLIGGASLDPVEFSKIVAAA